MQIAQIPSRSAFEEVTEIIRQHPWGLTSSQIAGMVSVSYSAVPTAAEMVEEASQRAAEQCIDGILRQASSADDRIIGEYVQGQGMTYTPTDQPGRKSAPDHCDVGFANAKEAENHYRKLVRRESRRLLWLSFRILLCRLFRRPVRLLRLEQNLLEYALEEHEDCLRRAVSGRHP